MYTIQIYYKTGNSFGSHDETDTIGYSFETREEARIVLSYIREHYTMYCDLEYTYKKVKDEIIKQNEYKPWFIKDQYDGYKYGIQYKDRRIDCFWCGYFESLYNAKIILENQESDEDSFTP